MCFYVLFFVPCTTFAESTTNAIPKLNTYPIVMVHGLFGWGNNEMFGFNYWGGLGSIKADMEKQDPSIKIFTPSIGPMSSNWDRACELYTQLVGGRVDYGAAHSLKDGHSRYGRTYPGFYTSISDINKIHLIGHSMGGETSRVLVQLLELGNRDEINATGAKTSPLFTGGHNWVYSVTTIATPHDGSSLPNYMNNLQPLTQQFFATIGAQVSLFNSSIPAFDFQLDQWGLKKQSDESYPDYFIRVMNSPLLQQTNNDLSVWDLTPRGAAELNTWAKAQSDVYYFSYACQDTHKDLITGYQVPNININPLLIPGALSIGSFTYSKPGDIVNIDSSWWRNDGLVIVPSAKGPHFGSPDTIIEVQPGQTTFQKGVWNYLGVIDNTDHGAVIGWNLNTKAIEPLYFDIKDRITHLP